MEFLLGLADHLFGMLKIEALFAVQLDEPKREVRRALIVIELEMHIHRLDKSDACRCIAVGGLEGPRRGLEIILVEGLHSLIIGRSCATSILIADLRGR